MKQPPTKAEEVLNLDYSEKAKDELWLSSQDTLRKLVGILGVLLPILLYLFLLIDTGYTNPMESISHYYMTRACSVFVIVVSLLAIFLLVYKGKEPIDFYISAAAGVFALLMILFPTDDISARYDLKVAVTNLKDGPFRPKFHYLSAGIFLLSLSYMSIFIFTKSDKSPEQRTVQKRKRNRLYRTCGIIMIGAIAVIILGKLKVISPEIYDDNNLTFWMETIAVESFGLSWLVKGELILKDKRRTGSTAQSN